MSLLPWPLDDETTAAVVMKGDEVAGALFSADGRHRFALWRTWRRHTVSAASLLAVVGLNPSTATHEVSDPTITRCVIRARNGGFGGLLMLNVGSLRSTDPRGLLDSDDWTGGELHARVLVDLALCAAQVVCAWGGPYHPRALGERVEARARAVVALLRGAGCELHALALTKDGHPRHPLYLRGDLVPEPWRPRA